MDLGLTDRVALVTGSSQGIGRSIATALGREGAFVVVTYCRNKEKGEGVVSAIRESGGRADLRHFDLYSNQTILDAVGSIERQLGRIDILVNNAAALRPAPIGSVVDPRQVEPNAMLRANIEGTYTVTQAVLPLMKAKTWGRIVSISSVLATDGMTQFAWYGIAKAALHGMTRSLYRDAGRFGVLINAVMPGMILTDRVIRSFPSHLLQQTAASTPIQRLLQPEEVATVVTFLCSAANTAITGEIIRASGGF